MFKKSRPHQGSKSDSGSIHSHLNGRKLKVLEDPQAWHNVFFSEITSGIDEQPYAVLYGKTGRPNAPVRILLSMLILKEGLSWTDEQLYNECSFNLQVMCALGLSSLESEVPAPSTYYDFKSRLTGHYEQNGEDLLGQTFRQLTQQQSKRYQVLGRELRMDSKLYNANIARCTRLQLVIGILQKFYKSQLNNAELMGKLRASDRQLLEQLAAQAAPRHTYSLKAQEQAQLLADLGQLADRILTCLTDDDSPSDTGAKQLLERLLNEQYERKGEDQTLVPKNKHAIDPTSMQSAHDTQATYRKKGKGFNTQIVRGFCTNITETCAEPEPGQGPCLHLITDVQTEVASISDDVFFRLAIEQSEQVTAQRARKAWTDGAYNSQPNADFVDQRKDQPLTWFLNQLQGPPSNFDFAFNADKQLLVTDLRTQCTQIAVLSPKKKWRIVDAPHTKNKFRYFDPVVIRNYFRRQQISDYPPELKKRRANVESTIHQVFNTLKGQKSKYRGLALNHFYALCRACWVNFRRISTFLTQKAFKIHHSQPICWLKALIRGWLMNQIPRVYQLAMAYVTIFYSVLSMNFLST